MSVLASPGFLAATRHVIHVFATALHVAARLGILIRVLRLFAELLLAIQKVIGMAVKLPRLTKFEQADF